MCLVRCFELNTSNIPFMLYIKPCRMILLALAHFFFLDCFSRFPHFIFPILSTFTPNVSAVCSVSGLTRLLSHLYRFECVSVGEEQKTKFEHFLKMSLGSLTSNVFRSDLMTCLSSHTIPLNFSHDETFFFCSLFWQTNFSKWTFILFFFFSLSSPQPTLPLDSTAASSYTHRYGIFEIQKTCSTWWDGGASIIVYIGFGESNSPQWLTEWCI